MAEIVWEIYITKGDPPVEERYFIGAECTTAALHILRKHLGLLEGRLMAGEASAKDVAFYGAEDMKPGEVRSIHVIASS